MADVTQAVPTPSVSIDPTAAIGAVHLIVSDLDRSLSFYEDRIGLRVSRREGNDAWLGAGGPDLLALRGDASARRVRGTTGLYHFAILVPSRADLARSVRHLLETGTRMQGFSDHGVSEASYLADPDGNGIEIYRDRPRDEWPRENGRIAMVLDPLDVDALVREAESNEWSAMPQGTTIGHMHLHVASITDAERFYVGVLGFDYVQRLGDQALFVSAGGYHHHVGLNTWAGVGAPAPPPGAIGLRWFEVRLPDGAARDRVLRRVSDAGVPVAESTEGPHFRDPSGNGIRLTIA